MFHARHGANPRAFLVQGVIIQSKLQLKFCKGQFWKSLTFYNIADCRVRSATANPTGVQSNNMKSRYPFLHSPSLTRIAEFADFKQFCR